MSETVEIEELDALYVKKLDEAIKDDANDSDRYRRFKKDIEDIKYTHDQHTNSEIKSSQTNIMSEDCDLEIEDETEVSCIDPITKKQITNPVRNKKCNHVYDFNSITSAIQQRRKMR